MNKRDALRLQQRAGLDRVLVDVHQSIARIRAAVPPRPRYVIRIPVALRATEEARFAALQLARDAERHVADLERLPAHIVETWSAAANLLGALESVEAELVSADPWLVEARHLMGAASAHIATAGQAARQLVVAAQHGSAGGRPSKADRNAALAARFEQLLRSRRGVNRRELYDDIAAEHDVGWTVVRDAVLAAEKAPRTG